MSTKLTFHLNFQIAQVCCKYNLTPKIGYLLQLQAERMSYPFSYLLVLVYCSSRWQKFALVVNLFSLGLCGQTNTLNFTLSFSGKQIKNKKIILIEIYSFYLTRYLLILILPLTVNCILNTWKKFRHCRITVISSRLGPYFDQIPFCFGFCYITATFDLFIRQKQRFHFARIILCVIGPVNSIKN